MSCNGHSQKLNMTIEFLKLTQFSGNKARFYTVVVNGEEESLYTKFVKENLETHPNELRDMMTRMYVMGHSQGAREPFFKMSEGTASDNVVALYDRPDKQLRLYCLRYGNTTVVLGGGGIKTTRTYQESPQLYNSVKLLQRISAIIDEAIKNKDIVIDEEGNIICEQILDDYEDD